MALISYSLLSLFGSDYFLHRNDDAFYYFTVARNFTRLGEWTFDGITPTSGVQPLWAGVLSAVAWVFSQVGGDLYSVELLRLFLWVAALFHIVSAGLLYTLLRRVFPQQRSLAVWALALWLFTPGLAFHQTMGMESSLYAVLFLLVLHQMIRLVPTGRSYAALGLGMGMLFLARLDSIAFSAALIALLVIHSLRAGSIRRDSRRLLVLALAFGAVTGPYLYMNHELYGHLLPISGQVKFYDTLQTRIYTGGWFTRESLQYVAFTAAESAGLMVFNAILSPFVYSADQLIWLYSGVSRLAAITVISATLLGAIVLGYAMARRSTLSVVRRRICEVRTWHREIGFTLLIASVVHFAVITLCLTDYVKYSGVGWYFVPQYVLLVVATAGLWRWFAGQRPRLILRILLVGLVVLNLGTSGWLALSRPPASTYHSAARASALWANEHLTSEARIGAFNAGIIGFYARKPVFNLDGLANNHTYFEDYYRPGRICAYLERYNITYMMDYVHDRSQCLGWAVAVGAEPDQSDVIHLVPYDLPAGAAECLIRLGPCQQKREAAES